MATFVEFEALSEHLAEGVHNLDTGSLKWYLTNTAPDAAADAVKADLPTEITAQNGYSAGGFAADVATSRTAGQTSIVLSTSSVLTASGAIGPFRYAVLYNDTPTSPADPVIGYIDHGSAITMADTDTYTISSGTLLTIN